MKSLISISIKNSLKKIHKRSRVPEVDKDWRAKNRIGLELLSEENSLMSIL